MEKGNIYIVEDMAITRATTVLVLKRAGYTIVGSSASAEKAWLELSEKDPTVVIIDVYLKGAKDGVWLAKKIRESMNCAIIFLTAYGSDPILDKIHDTDPDGYIMKPFNNPTLLSSVKMACRNLHRRNQENSLRENKYAIIKSREGAVKINKTKIIYIQSEGNYVHLHTASKTHEVRGKLDDIIQILDYKNLYRIHRRYAVNIKKIKSFDKNSVIVTAAKELPVSRSFNFEELMKRLDSNTK